MQIESMIEKLARHLAEPVRGKRELYVPALPSAAEALLVAALGRLLRRTAVWITDGPQTLEPALAARRLFLPRLSTSISLGICMPSKKPTTCLRRWWTITSSTGMNWASTRDKSSFGG